MTRESLKQVHSRTYWYLAMGIGGIALTAYTIDRIAAALNSLANPLTFVVMLVLAACLFVVATCAGFGLAFLFSKRFVAEVRCDGSTFTLISASGLPLVRADAVRVIKRMGNPFEIPPPEEDLFTIFSADKRWWICPSAGYAPGLVAEKRT
jgi:hypothetical protein